MDKKTTMPINLTINGKPVSAPEGSTILEAARGAGIRIPTLCHHPDLTNVGACRLCVVTVEKARGLQTACTTPAAGGMVVNTESQEARETRRFVLEMLLSDHPNECMVCETNGDCELQDLAYEYEVPWPAAGATHHKYEVDTDPNPFVAIDRNKCIVCGRCVRACDEIQNREVWNFANRGFKTRLVAGADQPMLEARCESCGQCVAYCPVGALYDKMSVGVARANKVEKVRTVCSYCGVGCSFDLNVRDDRVVRVTSTAKAPVNGMALCVKGRYGYDYVHHTDRLTKPLVRRDLLSSSTSDERRSGRSSDLVEVDWDTALNLVARKLTDIKSSHGGDAIAFFASAKCTNEENYLFNKFTRQVLGTNNIDHCARL